MIDINIHPNLLSADFVYSWVISWHGFFSFVAVATAVLLVGRWAPLKGVDPDAVYSTAIWAIIGGVVGARLVHVIDNWNLIYQQNPAQILNIAGGGIGLWGGILGGFAGGVIYAVIAKQPVGVLADLTAPVMLYSQTIGRLGDIVNGEHCAKATDFFLGFTWSHPATNARVCDDLYSVTGEPLSASQPVIVYEMLWNMLALAVVWRLRGRLRPDGMLFALYISLYSVGRFGVSFLRDDRIWALGLQEAHFIALAVLVITIPLLVIKARFVERAPQPKDDEAPVVSPRGTRAERRRRLRG